MATMIPPGGFMGFAQQTVAVQTLLRPARKKRRKKRRTSSARTAAVRGRKKTTRKKVAKKRTTSRGRLVKGSPAAKRRMKQLRAMQKRNR